MKVYLLLLLLLPLCSAQKFHIKCHGHDFLMLQDELLDCNGRVQQACFSKVNGEKGCTTLENCSREGWTCCHTNLCNV